MDQGTPGTHPYPLLRLDARSVGKLPRGPLRPLSRLLPPTRLPVPCSHPAPLLHSLRTGSDPATGLALRRPRPGAPTGRPRLCTRTRLARGLPAYAGCLRATRGAPARWAGTSVTRAAKAWQLSQRGIARRGGKVRHLWDLRWHGAKQAVANPGLAWGYAPCVDTAVARKPIYYVTVQGSRKNGQVFITISHCSRAGHHGGHDAHSSGPTNAYSFTSQVLPTGDNSGPASGPHSTARLWARPFNSAR